ncbi:hypothetical protein EVAR_41530_1 [Eumeta japonica]|uniref:Uncharacterized protein n=1 Tax=Eumeta variegata TaxID=151549 RepID=A0A4C1X405_EUMVA|nr:hypothetical protein EVAR_41530_1 [Eumeta japonica]
MPSRKHPGNARLTFKSSRVQLQIRENKALDRVPQTIEIALDARAGTWRDPDWRRGEERVPKNRALSFRSSLERRPKLPTPGSCPIILVYCSIMNPERGGEGPRDVPTAGTCTTLCSHSRLLALTALMHS